MREIILDTETTGLNPSEGHRVIEIEAIEIIDFLPTGKTFHKYINPERDVPQQSTDIHGLTIDFLSDKKIFRKIADEFLEFVSDSPIIAHNVDFDIGFLNYELSNCEKDKLTNKTIDTVEIAREKFPGQSVSLDALCKRYNINIAAREKHSAILDTELLSKVYIELLDKKEPTLDLNIDTKTFENDTEFDVSKFKNRELPMRLSKEEEELHKDFVETLGPKAIWKKINSN